MTEQDAIRYGMTILIVAVVMALRMRRMRGLRPLKLETLWIVPAIYAAVVVLAIAVRPPSPIGWLWVGGAAIVGVAIGWWRGSMMSIHVDRETQALNHRASPAAMILLVAIVLLRNLLQQGLPQGIPAFGIGGATIADALLALGFGLIAVARLEMFLRARRLLRESRSYA